MKVQRLASLVLLLWVTGLVSAAGDALHAPAGADPTSHPEIPGSSCPDPGDDGGPCGPTCPCACCPGHWIMAACVTVGSSLQPPPSLEAHASPARDLHPKDVHLRVFHPPRA